MGFGYLVTDTAFRYMHESLACIAYVKRKVYSTKIY